MDPGRVKELQLLAAQDGFILGYNRSVEAKFVLQGFQGLWEDEILSFETEAELHRFLFSCSRPLLVRKGALGS